MIWRIKHNSWIIFTFVSTMVTCFLLGRGLMTMFSILGGLSLSIEGPSKATINCVDNKDGTCTVSYLPTAPGEYCITVKFADNNISGSPFKPKITRRLKLRNMSILYLQSISFIHLFTSYSLQNTGSVYFRNIKLFFNKLNWIKN